MQEEKCSLCGRTGKVIPVEVRIHVHEHVHEHSIEDREEIE